MPSQTKLYRVLIGADIAGSQITLQACYMAFSQLSRRRALIGAAGACFGAALPSLARAQRPNRVVGQNAAQVIKTLAKNPKFVSVQPSKTS
jgi:hypothetical protein